MNTRRKLLTTGAGIASIAALQAAPTNGTGMLGALSRIAAAAGDATVGTARAQSADYRALVCIFLFGGNDANNMVVPTDAGEYGKYRVARGPLALDTTALLPISPLEAQGASYGLHPAMAGVQELFGQGKLAIVANVGPLAAPTTKAQFDARSVPLPDNLFSHSDQQIQWQTAVSQQGARTGWAGRVGDLLQADNGNRGATCISLAGNEMWQNGTTLTSYKVSPGGNFGFKFYRPDSNDSLSVAIGQLLAAQRSHPMEGAWIDTIGRALESQRTMADAVKDSQIDDAFPDTGIGRQLAMAARLVAARGVLGMRRQTMFCSMGGFDTHGDEQLPRQQQLLGALSAAIAAFEAALARMGMSDAVTLFTASDFNRNLRSNGKGSDHAWGSHHLVSGGAVRGNKFYGSFPDLALRGPDDSRDSGVWIPTTSVEQFVAPMATWLGVGATEMATVLPGLTRFGPGNMSYLA